MERWNAKSHPHCQKEARARRASSNVNVHDVRAELAAWLKQLALKIPHSVFECDQLLSRQRCEVLRKRRSFERGHVVRSIKRLQGREVLGQAQHIRVIQLNVLQLDIPENLILEVHLPTVHVMEKLLVTAQSGVFIHGDS